jgi:ATP-dependent Lon protease
MAAKRIIPIASKIRFRRASKSDLMISKMNLEMFVIKVAIPLCIGRMITLNFSEDGERGKKIFKLLEEKYKKHSIYVGFINDDRSRFLPSTTGLRTLMVGLNSDKLQCSFIGESRFEILDLDELSFDKNLCAYAKVRLLEDKKMKQMNQAEKEEVNHLRDIIDEDVAGLFLNNRWDWARCIFTEEPGALADKMVASEAIFEPVDMQTIFYTLDSLSRLRIAKNRLLALIALSKREIEEESCGVPQKCDERDDESGFKKRFEKVKRFMLPEMAEVVEDRIKEYYSGGDRDAKVETYLKNVLDLPWGKLAKDQGGSISQIRKQLDADHSGLNEPKEKILEFLAVRHLNSENKSSIMCLLGPPGVGKTSLGQSLGKKGALNRPLVRISMGGVHDEPAIRGYNYTYVGSGMGRIMQAIKQSGVMNPIILIDEIDKIGEQGANGNPAAAFLEVLDPLQNNKFIDHYLGGPVDLSGVFFILTGNNFWEINPILRDRLHIIKIEGYDMYEKFQIAKNFLVPKQLKNCGLEGLLSFTDEALDVLIQEYTNEAGVRSLERKIENICKNRAKIIVETKKSKKLKPMKIDLLDVATILGPPKIIRKFSRVTPVGCCNGLAVAGYVGVLAVVEASLISRRNSEIFTGVGEKVKDSVEKALSLLEGISPNFKEKIKQHFNEGAIHFNMGDGSANVDGPSAGIAILCALFSLFSGKPIRDHLAMTGAVGLTMGDVGAVGGIKEKVIGAMNAGITELILPEQNKLDFNNIDERIKNKFKKVHFVRSVEEVLVIVFGEDYKDIKI